MEPILTKEQIAELLLAIKSGQVSTDLSGEDDTLFDNVEPINLFQLGTGKDQQQRIPNLDIILDNFAQNFSISLTNLLQRTFHISRTSIEDMGFQEYLLSQKNAGAIGVLSLDPLKNGALMVFNGELCFSLIEIMLGASLEMAPLQLARKPTTIELNVLKSTMARACQDINKSFEQVIPIESSVLKVESNPRLVSIAEADAEILAGSFEVAVGELKGKFDIVFPVATLDPVREILRDLLTVRTVKQSGWYEILTRELEQMTTTIIARSGLVTMPVHKVMNLKKGDIIGLNYDPNSPLQVLVEDSQKFFAVPGSINGKKAIHLTGVQDQGE